MPVWQIFLIKYMLSPKFITDLKSRDVSEYFSPDPCDSITAYIEWEAEITFRDFGIKEITKIINSIGVYREWTKWNEEKDSDEKYSEEEQLNLSEWTVDTDFTNYISSMEIDFRDKKITIL